MHACLVCFCRCKVFRKDTQETGHIGFPWGTELGTWLHWAQVVSLTSCVGITVYPLYLLNLYANIVPIPNNSSDDN